MSYENLIFQMINNQKSYPNYHLLSFEQKRSEDKLLSFMLYTIEEQSDEPLERYKV